MTLIASKAHRGREYHIFAKNGDGRSLCDRAPLYEAYAIEDLSKVTCAACLRALQIFGGPAGTSKATKKKKSPTPRRVATRKGSTTRKRKK